MIDNEEYAKETWAPFDPGATAWSKQWKTIRINAEDDEVHVCKGVWKFLDVDTGAITDIVEEWLVYCHEEWLARRSESCQCGSGPV